MVQSGPIYYIKWALLILNRYALNMEAIGWKFLVKLTFGTFQLIRSSETDDRNWADIIVFQGHFKLLIIIILLGAQ